MAKEEDKQAIQDIASELYESGQLFRPLFEIEKTAPPLEPLWGNMFFRKAVTSIVGDPGICKTTMGYGMAASLCSNEEFLDIKPDEPIGVVYCDWESADSLIASRSRLITSKIIPNFFIFNIIELYLQSFATQLIQFCKENNINVVFLDSQSMAFPTRDENDNAEGIRQMRYIRSVAVACNAAFILYHHASKADLAGTRKGSGAFARARLADICINLEVASEEKPDIIKLEIVKNRLIDDRTLWYFEKKEGQFIRTEPPIGVAGKPTDNTLIYRVQQEILSLLNGNSQEMQKRKGIVATLVEKGFSERTILLGLTRLNRIGKIYSPQFGYYLPKN